MMIALCIDHTLLKPEASEDSVKKLADEAHEYSFGAVFVNPCHVRLIRKLVKNPIIRIGTVIGFPLGANDTEIKCEEAKRAIDNGANEIDMVINVGLLKSKSPRFMVDLAEVRAVVKRNRRINIKAILETGLLNNEEIRSASKMADDLGFDYVKTSTGFGPRGASLSDIDIMKSSVEHCKIKASGGIKTYQQAMSFVEAGASRIGTSNGVQIIQQEMLD